MDPLFGLQNYGHPKTEEYNNCDQSGICRRNSLYGEQKLEEQNPERFDVFMSM